MIIYVNGDSHSAGAELVKNYCFAEDDPRYNYLGRIPHPDAIPLTYGNYIANALNAGYFLDAESAGSNDRVVRTTREFLTKKRAGSKMIIIGWTTWERQEVWHKDRYYQFTASGSDIVPDELSDTYQSWVMEQTQDKLREKQEYWHKQIYDFHNELTESNIKHLFFNSMHAFDKEWTGEVDWQDCYIEPYNKDWTYSSWALNQGFINVNYGSNHYGEDAHRAWSKVLLKRLTGQTDTSIINVKKPKNKIDTTVNTAIMRIK